MPELPTAPFTPIDEVVEEHFGVQVRDAYRWLEDGGSERVREWTSAQNSRTRRYIDALPNRPSVHARLREALDVGALGGVHPRGRWRFFLRRSPGMNQPALYVRSGDERATERLLVDPAPLSSDAATAIDWYHPSDDGELVAYGISEAGSEDSLLRVLETATGHQLDVAIPRCRLATVAFEPGNRAFLYTRLPYAGEVAPGEEEYHRRLFRHVFESSDGDAMLFGRDKLEYPIAT